MGKATSSYKWSGATSHWERLKSTTTRGENGVVAARHKETCK